MDFNFPRLFPQGWHGSCYGATWLHLAALCGGRIPKRQDRPSVLAAAIDIASHSEVLRECCCTFGIPLWPVVNPLRARDTPSGQLLRALLRYSFGLAEA